VLMLTNPCLQIATTPPPSKSPATTARPPSPPSTTPSPQPPLPLVTKTDNFVQLVVALPYSKVSVGPGTLFCCLHIPCSGVTVTLLVHGFLRRLRSTKTSSSSSGRPWRLLLAQQLKMLRSCPSQKGADVRDRGSKLKTRSEKHSGAEIRRLLLILIRIVRLMFEFVTVDLRQGRR
jgi:hypothetical protein